MSTTYVITRQEKTSDRLFCCLLEEEQLAEVHIDCESQSLLGNIYVGKVKNVLKNIDAAFVEIAGGRTCFLPLSEAQRPVLTNRAFDGRILAGDEILVQVQKDAVKTKDPVLTANLSVTGTYASVSLGEKNGIRYSHKLSQECRQQLKEALKEVRVPEGATLVIRTRAQELCSAHMQADALIQEAEDLLSQASRLLLAGKTRTVFSLLSEKKPDYLKRLQDRAFPMPDKIITDDLSIFQTLQSIWKNEPDKEERLVWYEDQRLSLSSLYGLKGKLAEATGRQVWLKSGGYLVIEPTEALTVIDVNTGKYTGKKNTEETFMLINREAAFEAARQLRLRNLSGIIVVDFINLKEKEDRQSLLALLREACAKDPVPVRVVDMTPLGLVEITRKKVSRPLAELLKMQ